MRDGFQLSVDIYQPATPGRYASLRSGTSYGNNTGGKKRVKWFARRSCIAVLADTRGRFDSGDDRGPSSSEQKCDGYDLVERIARQRWSNAGGICGSSHMGSESMWTATQTPPSLKAIILEVAPPDGVMRARNRDPDHHGLFTAEELTTITPSQLYAYSLGVLAWNLERLRQRHRIRVGSSCNFHPYEYYLRNLNTGYGLRRVGERIRRRGGNAVRAAQPLASVAHRASCHTEEGTMSKSLLRVAPGVSRPASIGVLLLAALSTGCQSERAQAPAVESQAPAAGKYSPDTFAITETRGNMVRMRDGVRLSVDIYEPGAPGRYAGILSITPYDNNGVREQARWFAKHGYVVVAADSRGRYDSGGEWDPFTPNHKTDGYDLVEWMAKQDWSNGKVGMIGASYSGWTQWWTASEVPPHLAAIAPQVAPPDQMYNIPYQNGVMHGVFLDWAGTMSGRTAQIFDTTGTYGGGLSNTRARDLMHTPYLDINRARGLRDDPWFESWIRNNLSSAEYWRKISYQGKESYSRMTVPSLNFTGWFDADHPGAPMNYAGMKQYGATPEARRPTIIIGPWQHGINTRKVGRFDYGADAVIDLRGYITRWFDHFLKGVDNGVEKDPPVYVFVMGPNRWYAETDYPLPETKWTSYYLGSGGKANSLKGDGVLSTTPPSTENVDRYVYDPAKPTRSPWTGGHIEKGAEDGRVSEAGDDMLVYTTPPLTEDIEVTGPVEAKLFAATSAKDTDWMMRLVDVYPDGYAAVLTEGLMRARNRDPNNGGVFTPERLSTITPDSVYEYTIKFWRGTGNVFAKGHSIRVEISSSYYPYYVRNLNTGADNNGLVNESEAVVATQVVHHGPKYPSHIVLPVIPARKTEP